MARVGTRGRLLLAGVAILCLVALLGRGAESRGASPERETLRVGFASFPDYMDPQLSYSFEGWTAMYETYIPLLTYRRAGGRAGSRIVSGLARGLPKVSDGGRTYTLYLRRGLRYSDGSPVKASDFEYTVKRLLRMYSGGFPFYMVIAGAPRYLRTGRGGIRGIVANDETGRITIHLRRPSGSFLQLLAVPFAAPVPAGTPMRDRSFHPPPATGPYVISTVSPRRWTYRRNPAWTGGNGKRMPHLPDGYADRIEARVIRDLEAQVQSVLEGRLDAMQAPPPRRLAELRRNYEGTQLRMEANLDTQYFWMNTRQPPFNDLRVREAANYAVDRSVLVDIYEGRLLPTQQILPPAMPGYRKFEPFPYDLEKARQLVAAAAPRDRKVTVWVDTEPPHRQAAAYYRDQLQAIGLRPELKVVDSFAYLTAIGNSSRPDLDTGFSNWYADYAHPDDFLRPLLFGSSILRSFNGNFAQLSVPSLDARGRELERRPLTTGRERAYAALDRAYMRRAPWVPFGNSSLALFVAKRVDLDRVAWNPLFGPDLASFRFDLPPLPAKGS